MKGKLWARPPHLTAADVRRLDRLPFPLTAERGAHGQLD